MASRNQESLVAEKYGSMTRPVFAAIVGAKPSFFSASQRAAVRAVLPDNAWWHRLA